MTVAAIYGHLDIVRFLHENRTEGCSEDTLSLAAQNLHLDVVKFLREHYPQLQCCSSALDRVAAKGNLELLALLYTCSGNTECTATALTAAAKNGHSDVVAFLLQHQAEGSVSEALTLAALRGHLEVVKLLHAQLSPSESTFAALEAAARRHHHTIVQFLWEDPTRESSDFLKQAVDAGNIAIVRVFLRCASLEQLDEGREYALQQNRTKIAALLMRVLDDRRTQPSS
ncbi:hypothetical protein PybrP1_010958 [[Pythium] brassicae (nom. inval.)]|nr:hypothetical protein PybrP1_010958 [[Pythium] brassicae (nom. inval.)]